MECDIHGPVSEGRPLRPPGRLAADDFTTFDVKLDELLKRRRAMASDMLDGTGEIGSREFDIEERQPSA